VGAASLQCNRATASSFQNAFISPTFEPSSKILRPQAGKRLMYTCGGDVMTSDSMHELKRKAAKVAGATYLASFAVVVFVQFRIHDRLVVAHDPEATARNILAHQTLFRLGIALDLFHCAALTAMTIALYVILKSVNWGFALAAAVSRLIYVAAWILMTLNLFDALRLLNAPESLRVFEPERLHAWAFFHLSARFDQYYVGLLFYGLASVTCSYLWFKSAYIPKTLAVFGLASSLWCAVCTFVFIVQPNFADAVSLWWFDTPMGIFDLLTSFWLLSAGLRRPTEQLVGG
jgi:hypothetical protein